MKNDVNTQGRRLLAVWTQRKLQDITVQHATKLTASVLAGGEFVFMCEPSTQPLLVVFPGHVCFNAPRDFDRASCVPHWGQRRSLSIVWNSQTVQVASLVKEIECRPMPSKQSQNTNDYDERNSKRRSSRDVHAMVHCAM